MPNIIRILRNAVAGVRPAGKLAGEPWVNFSDLQFGVFNLAPTPLLAVRFWSGSSNYAIGDFVVSGGEIYRAVAVNFNSLPPSANWALVGGAAGGVDSFNTRTGAVTLSNADVITVLPGSNVAPLMDGVAAAGVGPAWARDDHVHPTDTSLLPLAGGTMAGQIVTLPPVAPGDAANKNYVDTMIASLRLFLGTWEVALNNPDLTVTGGLTNGDYYIAVTANPTVPETAPGGVAGIGGQLIGNGDLVLWNGAIFQTVRGSGLTLAEADSFYLALSGGAMTGALNLAADPVAAMQPVTLQFFENADIDAGVY